MKAFMVGSFLSCSRSHIPRVLQRSCRPFVVLLFVLGSFCRLLLLSLCGLLLADFFSPCIGGYLASSIHGIWSSPLMSLRAWRMWIFLEWLRERGPRYNIGHFPTLKFYEIHIIFFTTVTAHIFYFYVTYSSGVNIDLKIESTCLAREKLSLFEFANIWSFYIVM